ncbi:MAG: FG-GAP repeat domain-containing protein [Pirellulaceae bacterium]
MNSSFQVNHVSAGSKPRNEAIMTSWYRRCQMSLRCVLWLAAGCTSLVTAQDWKVATCNYRILVTVDPGSTTRRNCPVGVDVNFQALFASAKIPGRVDRHSIRVVQIEPAFRSPASGKEAASHEIPYQLTGDFPNDDAGRIWWRMPGADARKFHIYFNALGATPQAPAEPVGLIGIGDTFHYNHRNPGLAPVRPLHSQFWHIDWDGDGLRDLIGFAYRRYEYGSRLEKNLGNGVYFLKNIGTPSQPLFAPRYRLKASDGQYLQTDLLPQNMFVADWNRDGHPDFIGADGRKNLVWWENTSARDRNGLYLLKPAAVVTA